MTTSTLKTRRGQAGIALWIIVVIVVIVVVAVVGAVAVATSTPSTPSTSSGGSTPPGCIPAGFQCRLFIQNEVSCCGGQPVVGKRVGWCIGWFDALPCSFGAPTGSLDEASSVFAFNQTQACFKQQ